VTSLSTPPSIFLTGGSGFVGQALLAHANQPVRALQHSTPLDGAQDIVQGDLLNPSLPWSSWFEGMTHLLHAARPSAGTDRGRRRIAKRTAVANEAMLSSAHMHGLHMLAVHGSLSYGECGETLVSPASSMNPIGYAESYAIGEAPWRDRIGPQCTVVRAPWILGAGSWFPMLYGGASVPCFGDGSMWMSIVERHGFASWLWDLQDQAPGGVVHPPLLIRCRQRDFADAVAKMRGVEVETWNEARAKRAFGRQAAASMFASIRMDDGRGDASEDASNVKRLEGAIHSALGRS